MGICALTLLSVKMDHIHVPTMLHVQILLDPTIVPAIQASLEMVRLVLMILSVKMDHINAQLMQHVLTLLAHILVPVILAILEMEQIALI